MNEYKERSIKKNRNLFKNINEDNPLLRNSEANSDIFIGGNTKLLAQKRFEAILESHEPIPDTYNKWIQLGPTAIYNGQTYSPYGIKVLVTGRVTSIVLHPFNPSIIYLGTAQGGIWKTIDGGRNWKPSSDNEVSLAVGALAIDESNPLILYAGTGEGNFSGDSQYGQGILKTIDGGKSWELKARNLFSGTRFCRLAIHNKNPKIIFAAVASYGLSHSPSDIDKIASGLYRSKDGGETWSRMENNLPSIDNTEGATDVLLDPNSDTAYTALWGDGIYKTDEASAENPYWEKLTEGLPSANETPKISRIVLGISRSSSNTLYTLMSRNRIIDKFFCSDDRGSTWKEIELPNGSIGGQGTYNINISVNPNNSNIIYLSGISLWKAIRNPLNNSYTILDIGQEIHPDNHAFAFNPQDPRIIYAGNDGGIYQSNDEGSTWIDSINEGLCITQFNFMDIHPSSDAVILAGTQDNGTLLYHNSPAFYHSAGGDGGYCAIDQINPHIHFHTYVGPQIELSAEAGEYGSWNGVFFLLPPFENEDRSRNFLFYPPIALNKTRTNEIALGGKNILYLDDFYGIRGWPERIEFNFPPKHFISAINYVNSNLIYVGTNNGFIYRLKKQEGQWSIPPQPIHADPFPIDRHIMDIATIPDDETKIVVVVSGFGTPHVFYGDISPNSSNAAWIDITPRKNNGEMMDIPVNCIVIDDNNTNTFYIGTDAGVWITNDLGKNWHSFNEGLPNSQVYDMRLHLPTRSLILATHGRGIWRRQLDIERMNNVNIFVRKNIMDSGLSKDFPANVEAAFGNRYHGIRYGEKLTPYMCPDIKIDSPNQYGEYQIEPENVDYTRFEHMLINRNIQRGKVNHIYVQIHNRGFNDISQSTIKLLYCHYNTEFPKLPVDFWDKYPDNSLDITKWKPIGEIKNLPSPPKTLTYTEPTILYWEWNAPKDLPENIGLMIVIDSIDDPLSAETKKIFDIDSLISKEKKVGIRIIKVTN